MFRTILILLFLFEFSVLCYSAVGCDLNDPDRDVKRIFPNSTSYKTYYYSIDKVGGKEMFERIQKRLGEPFQGIYETIDVPYTVYEVYNKENKIGYIHGVNQKGQYGGIQVFLALSTNGVIQNFYIQKLTSRAAAEFRTVEFASNFLGLSLNEFSEYDVINHKAPQNNPISKIQNKNPEAEKDFKAIMRAIKKNLIIMDELVIKSGNQK